MRANPSRREVSSSPGSLFRLGVARYLVTAIGAPGRCPASCGFRAVLATEHGPRRGLQVTVHRDGKKPLVAQWGGISLARDTTPRPLNDDPAGIWSHRSELVQRLLADTCELCGSGNKVETHHIRALKDLNPKGRGPQPAWAKRMAARRRKTLVVCRACHEAIHVGRHTSRQSR